MYQDSADLQKTRRIHPSSTKMNATNPTTTSTCTFNHPQAQIWTFDIGRLGGCRSPIKLINPCHPSQSAIK
jgi:hypothetical protein